MTGRGWVTMALCGAALLAQLYMAREMRERFGDVERGVSRIAAMLLENGR